mgnify:CR=1 FL=1
MLDFRGCKRGKNLFQTGLIALKRPLLGLQTPKNGYKKSLKIHNIYKVYTRSLPTCSDCEMEDVSSRTPAELELDQSLKD